MSSYLEDEHDYILPPEILNHIFSYLTVSDRKRVRLTCSLWYNACNAISLVQNERMVVRQTALSCDELFDALINCSRPRFDFEFYGIQFNRYSSLFWQKCGSRVESLKLQKCSFTKESASAMMNSCTSLKSLHVDQSDDAFHFNEVQVCHKNLASLTLEKCFFVTDYTIDRLFDVYPCIEKFELKSMLVNFYKRIDARFYRPETQIYNSDSIFTFSCVFSKISLNAEIIQKLNFRAVGENGLTDDWLNSIGSLSSLKLKELDLHLHPLLSEKVFLEFFSKQTSLKHVCISKCPNFSLKCFLQMIEKCTNLMTINVESSDVYPNFSMSKEILSNLIALPHLTSLKLKGFFFMDENINRAILANDGSFRKLRALTLKMPTKYYDIFIPRMPLNLSALHLLDRYGNIGLTDQNLQIIFDKLIHLRSLSASLDISVTDYGFVGSQENRKRKISISRLKRLEKLSLGFRECVENSVTRISFSCFKFLNLRKLRLFNFMNVSNECFELLSNNLPSLECLELKKSRIESCTLMLICERWKKLCSIVLFYSGNIPASTMEWISKYCADLKFYQLDNHPIVYVNSLNCMR